jgi:hypothetical protein
MCTSEVETYMLADTVATSWIVAVKFAAKTSDEILAWACPGHAQGVGGLILSHSY